MLNSIWAVAWIFEINEAPEVLNDDNSLINVSAKVRGEESFVNSFRVDHLHYFQQFTPGFKSSQYWNAFRKKICVATPNLLNISLKFHINDSSHLIKYINSSINFVARVKGKKSLVNPLRVVHLHYFQQSIPQASCHLTANYSTGFKSSQYWIASEILDAT